MGQRTYRAFVVDDDVTDRRRSVEYAPLGIPLSLPASYESLRRECMEVSVAVSDS